MSWTAANRRERHPEVQAVWETIGAMVKRRRLALHWTQRDLNWRSGLDQAAICRLERGTLRGLRFKRFVAIVFAMNGLDPTAPAPERRPRMIDLFRGPYRPESERPLPDWLPHRDGPRSPPTPRPAPRQVRISLDVEGAEPSTSALEVAH